MTVFTELAIIIVFAAVMAALMRFLKQPIIIGHILTGILAGPLVFDFIHSEELLQVLSELGIAFLLFIVGINLSPRVIKEVGKASVLTGLGQIVFTSLFGYLIAWALGFTPVVSLYLALALTFSSTIIILKLLSDKLALEKLYGKISMGFLIVQDIVAALILVAVSTLSKGDNIAQVAFLTLLKGLLLGIILISLSRWVLPRLTNFFARQQELLFLFSLGWGLGLSTIFQLFGFSIEIGALAAGVALAGLPYSVEISARLKPLRDFFIVMFFILLGGQMVISSVGMFIVPVVVFSLFVLIGNPLVVVVIMSALGYSKRTGFLAGLTVAQISEFSLLLVVLGMRSGHLDIEIVSLVTAVGLITIAGSSYMIMYSEKLYTLVEPLLGFSEKVNALHDDREEKGSYEAILFGLNRVGYDFLKVFRQKKMKFLVVDFDPEVSKELSQHNISHRYGDADDTEFLDSLPLEKQKIIVSTIPDYATNALLINRVRQKNKKAIIIVLNHSVSEAIELYKHGASYVVLPHFLGGRFASEMVEQYGARAASYQKERKAHLKDLETRVSRGHEHPLHEKFR